MVKRSIASTIKYNEVLTAGQEQNFNCKLLLKTTNLYYLDTFLTLRRYNPDSIQGKRGQSSERHLEKIFHANWYNYLDIKEDANSPKFNRYSLLQCVYAYLESKNKIRLPKDFINELKSAFPKRYYFFHLASMSNRWFGKYFTFYKRLKSKEIFNTYASRKAK